MKYLIQNKHWKINKEYNIDKLLYLLIDRSDKTDKYNPFIWENKHKQFHRDYHLPSLVGGNSVWWHINGRLIGEKH